MKITIGDYLIKRLKELNIKHLIGEPGDFNLQFLEQVAEDDGLEFVGMSNELNAAFAADGYANENGISALLTTYSVGDLNALGGIAGSVAEGGPIIVISGAPPLYAMREKIMTHHTLANSDYSNVKNAMDEFVADSALITPANAATEIDRLLQIAFSQKMSVNLQLPSNITYLQIDVDDDLKPIEKTTHVSDAERLKSAVRDIKELYEKAERPVVLVDKAVSRFEIKNELLELIEKSQTPFAAMSTAKSLYDESHPLFVGIYEGEDSTADAKDYVENADFLLTIDPVIMQANSGSFTFKLPENTVNIHADYVDVAGEIYEAVYYDELLDLALRHIPDATEKKDLNKTKAIEFELEADKEITQAKFYKQIARYFKNSDMVYGETGSASLGLSDLTFPDGVTFVASQVWGSIGAMLPMQMGAMLASPEKRHILVVGDGSFQVSAQAFSRMIYNKQNPIIFLIDNDGYTIERFIMGMKREYNDIPQWDYSLLAKAFGPDSNMKAAEAHTEGELEEILKSLDEVTEGIIITVHMHAEDAPEALLEYGDEKAGFNYGDRGPDNPDPADKFL